MVVENKEEGNKMKQEMRVKKQDEVRNESKERR